MIRLFPPSKYDDLLSWKSEVIGRFCTVRIWLIEKNYFAKTICKKWIKFFSKKIKDNNNTIVEKSLKNIASKNSNNGNMLPWKKGWNVSGKKSCIISSRLDRLPKTGYFRLIPPPTYSRYSFALECRRIFPFCLKSILVVKFLNFE